MSKLTKKTKAQKGKVDSLKLYPLEATYAGDNRYDDLLPNVLTDSFRAELTAFYQRHLEALGGFDRGKLSEEEQMSREVLKWECEMNLKQLRFPTHLLPVDQFNSLHLTIGQLAGGTSAQPFKTVADYEAGFSLLPPGISILSCCVLEEESNGKPK